MSRRVRVDSVGQVRISAIAVFEGVIYSCVVIDGDRPDRPVLELDAVVRPGDADDGPLLLPVPTFMALVGGPDAAVEPLRRLAESGRLVEHQGIAHIAFPMWTTPTPPAGATG